MATLVFKNSNLKEILNVIKEATVFRASLSEKIIAYEENSGKEYDFDPKIDLELYSTHNRPTVWLVKDRGIYIMSSALVDEACKKDIPVCYAEGFHPNNKNCYEKCRAAMGGDDFVESIPFEQDLQEGISQGADLYIKVTTQHIDIILKYPTGG
ncbi:DUF3085 domain-containing protein [Chitinophaga niabensis]|uniref:DUF3085 domain-containing protein n=1 Tax=Chitinophaga niabensis TaxID=536979 RepID=A0A1N6KBJ6_9BACT|nr:DUF3085 domain-containing protein [Chitinophaga niabensis]SIO53911.1 Protein of unknown function [Chitinophaga niabensis]